jgi:hypothetical protein
MHCTRRQARRTVTAAALCALCALAGCATASGTDKGGLVKLDVSPRALDEAHGPQRVALLVGTGTFDDPEWRKLRYPSKDAADLARVLRDPQRGAFTRVDTVSEPTRAEIWKALQQLGEANRDERDTVVLYLSSHGTLARDAHGQLRRYLVTRDTRMSDIPGTAIPIDEIKARFDGLRSRRKVLILAACHSGGGKSLLPRDVLRELEGVKAGFLVRPLEDVSRASVVLAASDWGEAAREDEKLQNDIYTHYFVEALQLGADRNGDGAVTVSEAHDYARRMTYEYTDGRQRPTAESTEVGVDPIVLVGQVRRKGRPELYSYAPALDGFTMRVNGRPLAELPGGVALDAGRHRLQVVKGSGASILDVPVTLGPGQRIDVEELLARADPRWEVAPRLALLSFLDGRSRRDIMGSILGAGATLTYREWPGRRMALRLDLVGSAGGSQALGARINYSAFSAGASLPWRFPVITPGLTFLVGPRLSAFYLTRRFDLDLAGAPQTYFVMTPGLLLGTSYDLSSRLTVGVELQLDWALLRVDGQNRSSAFGQVLAGAGYRF